MDPAPSCQSRISKLSLLFSPSTKTEARFDDDKIGDGLGERDAVVAVVVVDDSPILDVVNDEEVLLVTFNTLVRIIGDVATVVSIIVSFGRVFIIKADFRVNLTTTTMQLMNAEITAINIVNGSIFFL